MRTRSRQDYCQSLQRAAAGQTDDEREETLLLLGHRAAEFAEDVETIRQHVFQLNLLSQLAAISRSLQILSGESTQ